jgi:chloride channel protein, CIC family
LALYGSGVRLELTHDFNALLPLLVATLSAHCFTVLTLKRSILTEKVASRGYHLSREYAVDPLEVLSVREVMRMDIAASPSPITQSQLAHSLPVDHKLVQILCPIVDPQNKLVGVVTRRALQKLSAEEWSTTDRPLTDLAKTNPVVAYPEEPLRIVIYRMGKPVGRDFLWWLPMTRRN